MLSVRDISIFRIWIDDYLSLFCIVCAFVVIWNKQEVSNFLFKKYVAPAGILFLLLSLQIILNDTFPWPTYIRPRFPKSRCS